MSKSRRATTRTKREQVVTQHGPDPLSGVVAIHWINKAKQITLRKVRGATPERWEVEAVYDEWEEIG